MSLLSTLQSKVKKVNEETPQSLFLPFQIKDMHEWGHGVIKLLESRAEKGHSSATIRFWNPGAPLCMYDLETTNEFGIKEECTHCPQGLTQWIRYHEHIRTSGKLSKEGKGVFLSLICQDICTLLEELQSYWNEMYDVPCTTSGEVLTFDWTVTKRRKTDSEG